MSFITVTQNIPKVSKQILREHIEGPLRFPRKGGPPASLWTHQEAMHLVDDLKAVNPSYIKTMSVFGPQPFSFDSRFWDLVDMDGYLAYDDSRVGREGAGPSLLTRRYVQWLHLKRKGARGHLHLFNTHAPPSLQVPLQEDGDVSRDDLHETLMKAIALRIQEIETPVLLQGDFNCTWDHSNMRPIHDAGMVLCNRANQGTHGDHPGKLRQIDLILRRGGLPVKKRWQLRQPEPTGLLPQVKRGDHFGVWAELDFVR